MISLGPPDPAIRQQLAAAIAEAGLDPVLGDGVEDALAGIAGYDDDLALATATSDAARAFGQLDCAAATSAAKRAIEILAGRQAAGVAVPELSRAWTYVLLCAERQGDTDAALTAAARIRAIGGDVDAKIMAKYPEVDTLAGGETVEIDVTSEIAGAALWVDFAPAGATPAHLVLTAGEHVIAAGSGTRRGSISGTPVASQPTVTIAMPDHHGPWTAVATRIASWHGAMPSTDELAAVLVAVNARAAVVRHGDVVEAWGHAGKAEPVRRLGGEDGTRAVSDASRLIALVVDRVQGWNDHAPDPDQPLLVESPDERIKKSHDEPTKWWVYATIGAAVLAGAIAIYAHDSGTDTQRVELHYP